MSGLVMVNVGRDLEFGELPTFLELTPLGDGLLDWVIRPGGSFLGGAGEGGT